MKNISSPIRVGISSCLMGQKVRFDGNHKHQKFITEDLGKLFEYVPICPEVAIGMGVPRKPIRLVNDTITPSAQGVYNAKLDVTDNLVNFAKEKATQMGDLSGYIFKKGSPSCGMQNVKIYRGKDLLSTQGIGLYAKEIMSANPLLPVEEEGRLTDPGLYESFVQRVTVYHRWQQLITDGLSAKKLVDFHSRHKFILLAHDEQTYRSVGKLIAKAGVCSLSEVADKYITELLNGLKKQTTRKRHTNVLQHLMGYLKRYMSSGDKKELCSIIEEYRKGGLPLDVPIVMLRHYLRHYPSDYIRQQYYLYG